MGEREFVLCPRKKRKVGAYGFISSPLINRRKRRHCPCTVGKATQADVAIPEFYCRPLPPVDRYCDDMSLTAQGKRRVAMGR